MGVVSIQYHWDSISPNETVGVFIHGYAPTDFASYNAIPSQASNEPPGALTVQCQLTNSVTTVHVDGTIAHTLYVQNLTIGPQPYISVNLVEFFQQQGG